MPLSTDHLTLLVGARALGPAAAVPSKALASQLSALLADIDAMLQANGDAIAAHLAGDDAALAVAADKIKGLVRRVSRRAATVAPRVAEIGALLSEETLATLASIEAMAVAIAPDPEPVIEEPAPDA